MEEGTPKPTIFVYAFLVGFLAYFIFLGNYEFIGYTIVVGLFYFAILMLDKYYDFPVYAVWLFFGWIVLHMLGGAVYLDGTRLYDVILFPIINSGGEMTILKYDQFVHAYCYVAFSILVYFALSRHFQEGHEKALIVFTILAAIGIGVLNEIIEFAMVLFADAADAVGGYYNTALDLVFNLVGAIIGTYLAKNLEW